EIAAVPYKKDDAVIILAKRKKYPHHRKCASPADPCRYIPHPHNGSTTAFFTVGRAQKRTTCAFLRSGGAQIIRRQSFLVAP
ncbi:MAG: hypothetical protein LBJ58_08170, partial [Tannerellaceae bacterium]|nr:hypothetical protein [Tannerellaceae bacterium]